MIVIVGESASGKKTLQKMITENNMFYRVVTYTTRPKRKDEIQGVHHHFVTDEEFDELNSNSYFAETIKHKGYKYGSAMEDCKKDNGVVILTPSGLRAFKRNNIDCISVYLKVDRESRLIQSICRGDDIDEAYKTNLLDVGQYDDICNEVDYVIDNFRYHMSEDEVLRCFYEILKIASKEE